MPSAPEPGRGFLALRDRAVAYVESHGRVEEAALLAHVYGGVLPQTPRLRAHLLSPLLSDPRLENGADGFWVARRAKQLATEPSLPDTPFTALALVASGPNPARGRVVRLAAQHVHAGKTLERFSATLNPSVRVPRYVADRLRLTPDLLDELPGFGSILDELIQFLGTRPVLAQDAQVTWAFLVAEARRVGVVLAEPALMDVNDLAVRLLDVNSKPTLALVAAGLGIGTLRVSDPEEEVRVLGLVGVRLLALADERGAKALITPLNLTRPALRSHTTARTLPDEPGVYVMRDAEQTAVYVGKARRLRSRLAAYINRPLGVTRRLEGLVGAVRGVDSSECDTDLEALVLEDREIRRLQPRFNTVRQQRAPRLWIRLPPMVGPRRGKRQLAPRRLQLSLGPSSAAGEFVGPFRNETAAEAARQLARKVFELDAARPGDAREYEARLRLAWDFLHGDSARAEQRVQHGSGRLRRAVLAFDLRALLLPADPRDARYAVIRPGPRGVEGFVVDQGILRRWIWLQGDDAPQFATRLLAEANDSAPRTGPGDVAVVLRWLGAQHAPARLIYLPDDPLAASDAIENAVLRSLGGSGETRRADPNDPF